MNSRHFVFTWRFYKRIIYLYTAYNNIINKVCKQYLNGKLSAIIEATITQNVK